jgi:hypothetical protein
MRIRIKVKTGWEIGRRGGMGLVLMFVIPPESVCRYPEAV